MEQWDAGLLGLCIEKSQLSRKLPGLDLCLSAERDDTGDVKVLIS